MKYGFFALFAAALLVAANIHSVEPSGLTVHEWGTFTSVAGEDGSAIEWDALGCKSDLPKFVVDYGYRGFKWTLQGTVRMETPVMYFYSAHALDAHVKVAFPQGLITEWYPQADYQVHQGGRSMSVLPADTRGVVTSLGGTIEWKNIQVQPGTAPALPVENGPSRYYAARQTDAAPIAVGAQHEKFLFYRGVGRFPVPLAARVADDGKIVVENRGGQTVPSVILFENRGGRIGYRAAGAIGETITLNTPPLDASLPQLRQDLETALTSQGLYAAEAHAMVETWRDSWFEEGSRLIYIVPSSTVDAILPLQIDPVPQQTVRVFVGRIELITPETRRAVEFAVAKSDWPAVDRYSRFLGPILDRIYAADPGRVGDIEQQFQHSQGCPQ
ncbi:MAG: hypothetical protein ABSF54_01815 [Bryobacteraceae bacterium]|jgi:hypothetical protein